METVFPIPETRNETDISMDFSLSSHLLNRTQWYYLQCKFTQKDKPTFVGQTIAIDPSVSFQDGRKRTPNFLNSQPPFLSLSVTGVCGITGKMLQKCQKCKAQDKVTTNRKRKRDVTDSWTNVDEGNNAKLFQVMNCAPKVDEEGIIKLRFRALCCIGATRQFHNNHINNEGDEEGIHKGCDGFLLTVILLMDGGEIFRRTSEEPIRVIGKVPKSHTSSNSVEKPREKNYIPQTLNLDTCHFYPESESQSPESPTVPFDHVNGLEITHNSLNSVPREGGVTAVCGDDPRFIYSTQINMESKFSEPPISSNTSVLSNSQSFLKIPYQNFQVPENFSSSEKFSPSFEYDDLENFRNIRKFPGNSNSESELRRVFQVSKELGNGCKEFRNGMETYRKDEWKTGISDFLDAVQEGTDLFSELRNTALLFKIKIDSKYPIVYRKIFEPDYFKQANLLKIPCESTELLTICNVIYEGTLCQENSSVYAKNKAEQLCYIGSNIAHELLKLSVRDMSSDNILYLADALTRHGIIQVQQRKDLASGRLFLHQSFQLYEYLSITYPHLRSTPYYEIMMWHRCYLDSDPSLINMTFEWVRTLPQSKIFPHIIFLMIFSVCYPGLSTGAAGVPDTLHFPGESQKNYLLELCYNLEELVNGFTSSNNNGNNVFQNGMLTQSAIGALRSWLMYDLDRAVEEVEESAIQASLIANTFMDPLPIQIAIFVAIQIMGQYSIQEFDENNNFFVPFDTLGDVLPLQYYDPEEDKRRRRLVHYVELLVKASRMALVRVWTFPLEVFNLAMFHKFCRVNFSGGYCCCL